MPTPISSNDRFMKTTSRIALPRKVRVVALDDIPIRHPVRFVKMDVEGGEALVSIVLLPM
jgi:hypothetical protein